MLRLKVALAASAVVVATAAVQLGDGGLSSIRRRLMATEVGERLAGWFTPPYIYVLLNAIILSIAALDLFMRLPSDPAADFGTEHARGAAVEWSGEEMKEVAWEGKDEDSVEAERLSGPTELPTGSPEELPVEADLSLESDFGTEHAWWAAVEWSGEEMKEVAWAGKDADPVEEERLPMGSPEELPVVIPFGYRRNGKSESNIYKAARRKRRKPRLPPADSLESIWLAIMEGRGGSRRTARDDDNVQAATTEKASSEIKSLQAATELRRDSWLEKEELNRRVEEFIKKFNDEMRLQHQRSMQQYVDMINRGCA